MTDDPGAPRLFAGCCAALTATAFCFACIAGVLDDLRIEFGLTSSDAGVIAGAALWGLAVGQMLFAPLNDVLGMRALLRSAWILHVAGVLTMITAHGIGQLVIGAVLLSTANGIVEATCNPLVASLYPERKAIRLSHFHLWFPCGIALGGVAVYLIGLVAPGAWQAKLAVILVPTLLYGALTWRQGFPMTESRRDGVTPVAMIREALTSRLMWVLLGLMMVTASLELGPNRWMPSVLESGGMPGILVLVAINGVMAAMRSQAHRLLGRAPPTVVLLASVLTASVGLVLFSSATSVAGVWFAAAIFAPGVAFLWPLMVGLVAERVPRSGAVGLGLLAATGAAFVGLVTTPLMGAIADRWTASALSEPAVAQFANAIEQAATPESDPSRPVARNARALAQAYAATGHLPGAPALAWLRQVIRMDPDHDIGGRARQLLRPAENAGGLHALRMMVPYGLLAAAMFAALLLWDRRHGGYARCVAKARERAS